MSWRAWLFGRERDTPSAAADRRDDDFAAINPRGQPAVPEEENQDPLTSATRAPQNPSPTHAGVIGERDIPSVNRERSIQSRVSTGLALLVMLLLGGAFLAWYYTTQLSRHRDAQDAAKRAGQARAAGEMKVPPLGRVEPPQPPSPPDNRAIAVADIFGPAPPPPPAATTLLPGAPAGAAPPPKTPAELALERQLNTPVLLRVQGNPAVSTSPATLAAPAAPPAVPTIGLGGLVGSAAGRSEATEAMGDGNRLATLLRPTQTAAVTAQRMPPRRFLLPKGAFINCTLETAIDSTFDGMTTCIGAEDVYSADGKVVLLERGTKYVGEKRGELRQGQARVFVLWSEARTPAGVVVNLASAGTDELGRAGVPGYVDTHFWQRFGAAIMISLIDGAIQALVAQQRREGGGNAIVLNPQGSRDIMTEVLKGSINIPPTVIVEQGKRIQVLVARDVDFRGVYALRIDDHAQ